MLSRLISEKHKIPKKSNDYRLVNTCQNLIFIVCYCVLYHYEVIQSLLEASRVWDMAQLGTFHTRTPALSVFHHIVLELKDLCHKPEALKSPDEPCPTFKEQIQPPWHTACENPNQNAVVGSSEITECPDRDWFSFSFPVWGWTQLCKVTWILSDQLFSYESKWKLKIQFKNIYLPIPTIEASLEVKPNFQGHFFTQTLDKLHFLQVTVLNLNLHIYKPIHLKIKAFNQIAAYLLHSTPYSESTTPK